MSANIQACETYLDLTHWLEDNLSTGSLHVFEGEIIIYTGLEINMNGELSTIEEHGDEW